MVHPCLVQAHPQKYLTRQQIYFPLTLADFLFLRDRQAFQSWMESALFKF